MTLLEINDLKVINNKKKIIDMHDTTIKIEKGDKVAILGPNGAGKTTLINAIIGEQNYIGHILKEFSLDQLGIVFQKNEYSSLMKVSELIQLVFNVPLSDIHTLKWVSEFQIASLLDKYVNNLSGGEKQRLTLAISLNQHKKIFIFDELTSGLDYEKRMELINKSHKYTLHETVLQISHYFEEIQDWANKVLVLQNGRLLYWGTLKHFLEKYYHFSTTKIVRSNKSESLLQQNFNNYFSDIYQNESEILIYTRDAPQLEELEKYLRDSGITYYSNPQNFQTSYLKLINLGDRNA